MSTGKAEESMTREGSFLARFSMVLALLVCLAAGAWAQSIVSGDVTGTVTDPSGAVIPGAKITLKNNDSGQTQNGNSNASGVYRFALLKPGRYTLTVTQSGFGTVTQGAFVSVGGVTRADVKLAVGSQAQTVEVTAETPLIQSDNGNTQTSFNTAQIDASASPGGDITTIAELAPGIQTNTSSGGGYGNFTSNGIPATANLFTVNGSDEMDPYLNLNNSGASNLAIGSNELAEVTITTNGYTGEYGRNAGAQVNYATKSGTNHFHGNAIYNWSGAAINARDWFDRTGAAPNTHDHQWAGGVGGPIWRDKTFFFVDTEGIKYTLPTSNNVTIPSPAYQAATLATVAATGQTAFYQQMFNLWNSAPGAANAVVDPANPNVSDFRNAVTNSAHEWILIARLDHQFTPADKVYFRYKTDHGVQPTFTDPISPVFNATSTQPAYEGQANWTHSFSNAAVNQFILSGSYYSAVFKSANQAAALAAFPYSMFPAGPYTPLGGENFIFPQGRNVGQAQVVDDFSFTKGKHSLKFGVNYRNNHVTDFVYSERSVTPEVELLSEAAFGAGNWDDYIQRFSPRNSEPFVLYSLGFYGQDQWKVSSHLTLTLALRGDRNSNPSCTKHCFSLAPTDFVNLNHNSSVPYNQALINGQSNAFHSLEPVAWQPRFGFAFTPYASGSTVLRGGIGIFSDIPPGVLAEFFSRNVPQQNSFTIQNQPASPTAVGSAQSAAIAANTALLSVYNSGGTAADLIAGETAAGALAAFPNIFIATHHFTNPKFLKYNLELQQGFGSKTSVSLNYNGNHGRDIIVNNPGLNAFCIPARCGAAVNGFPSVSGPISARQSPVDGRFGTVSQYSNTGNSDYNGVTVSLQRRYATFQMAVAYTWSHATDDVSNGGINPFSLNDSLITQINPQCLRCQNWGNADYDFRHYLQANYSWTPGYKFKHSYLDSALSGWTFSNTYFLRSGLPFSIYDSTLSGTIRNYGSELLLNLPNGPFSCGAASPRTNQCFDINTQLGAFVAANGTADPSVGVASNQRRNQNRGPKYFDSDISLAKTFKIAETLHFGVGINAFNFLNHPNFANPLNDIANGPGTQGAGAIVHTVGPPTSPFGSFAGVASGRIVQLNARITF
jgi:hypothetical protein